MSDIPPDTRDSLGTTFKRILKRLILPSNAGPNDGAIILDPNVTGCLGTRYDAVIVWRASNPSFRGQYYMGVVKSAFLPSGTVAWIERGYMLNDVDTGVCWVYITGRIQSDFDPVLGNSFSETVGNIGRFGVGAPAPSQDFIYDIQGHLYVHAKFITTENDCRSAVANASTSTNNAAFTNYPTTVQCSVLKLGGSAETCFQIDYSQTFYVDQINTGPLFGVQVNGPSGSFNFITHQVPGVQPAINSRLSSFGMVKTNTIAMIKGTYTFTPLWARFNGPGSIFSAVNEDWTSLKVSEVTL
jgi:hypothetical protein